MVYLKHTRKGYHCVQFTAWSINHSTTWQNEQIRKFILRNALKLADVTDLISAPDRRIYSLQVCSMSTNVCQKETIDYPKNYINFRIIC